MNMDSEYSNLKNFKVLSKASIVTAIKVVQINFNKIIFILPNLKLEIIFIVITIITVIHCKILSKYSDLKKFRKKNNLTLQKKNMNI